MTVRGRFAPSPTGDLHLGGARTALVAWLSARSAGGRMVLRIEDLDPPRAVAGSAERIVEDLLRLGLFADEGPEHGPHAPYRQSQRAAFYDEALTRLQRDGRVYPCFCSRAEIARAASAPHGPSDDGPRYPGTCRELTRERVDALLGEGRRPSLRFRLHTGADDETRELSFLDAVHGEVRRDPAEEVGDFVLRRGDGIYAYQLAVVVDDAAMGITEVVRGDDLLSSTTRQMALCTALGLPIPRYAHVPLCLGPDGQRLGKSHGSLSVRALLDDRTKNVSPGRVIARLAETLGLLSPSAPPGAANELTPDELVAAFSFDRIVRTPSVLDPSDF